MNWKRAIAVIASAATMIGMAASPGIASTQESYLPAAVDDDSTVYIPGQDVIQNSCKGWMNRRTTDNYVQALGQSWGAHCGFWLERKRIGEYDWTQVSYTYEIDYPFSDRGLPSTGSTGFHWNGTNAGSRVCLIDYAIPQFVVCSSGYW